MKKFLAIILAGSMIFTAFCLVGCNGGGETPHTHNFNENYRCDCGFSVTPSKGLEYELTEDETGYEVTGLGECTDTDVVIPYKYNNLPITSIGIRAFYDCYSLTRLSITNGQ